MSALGRWLWYWFCVLTKTCEWRLDAKKFTCPCEGEVKWESGRSAYHTREKPDSYRDPNRRVLLCREHAAEHHERWDDLWDQVPRG